MYHGCDRSYALSNLPSDGQRETVKRAIEQGDIKTLKEFFPSIDPGYQHWTLCWCCEDTILGYGLPGDPTKWGPVEHYSGQGESTIMGYNVRVCPTCWQKIQRKSPSQINEAMPKTKARKPKSKPRGFGLTEEPIHVKATAFQDDRYADMLTVEFRNADGEVVASKPLPLTPAGSLKGINRSDLFGATK